jgi:hypothetical protein
MIPQISNISIDQHSKQARAPLTNGLRDAPRCGALSLLTKQKPINYMGRSEDLLLNPFVLLRSLVQFLPVRMVHEGVRAEEFAERRL